MTARDGAAQRPPPGLPQAASNSPPRRFVPWRVHRDVLVQLAGAVAALAEGSAARRRFSGKIFACVITESPPDFLRELRDDAAKLPPAVDLRVKRLARLAGGGARGHRRLHSHTNSRQLEDFYELADDYDVAARARGRARGGDPPRPPAGRGGLAFVVLLLRHAFQQGPQADAELAIPLRAPGVRPPGALAEAGAAERRVGLSGEHRTAARRALSRRCVGALRADRRAQRLGPRARILL